LEKKEEQLSEKETAVARCGYMSLPISNAEAVVLQPKSKVFATI
jgi:hypothetical protein